VSHGTDTAAAAPARAVTWRWRPAVWLWCSPAGDSWCLPTAAAATAG